MEEPGEGGKRMLLGPTQKEWTERRGVPLGTTGTEKIERRGSFPGRSGKKGQGGAGSRPGGGDKVARGSGLHAARLRPPSGSHALT